MTDARTGVSGFLRDLRIGMEAAGVSEFGKRVFRGAIARFYRRIHLMVIEQDLDALSEVRTPEGVQIRPFDDDWGAVEPILTSRLYRDFQQRSKAGRTCLLAWRGDDVVGYTWISWTIDEAIEGLPLALPDGASYGWDLFVSRSERGTGIGSALTRARLVHSLEAGKTLGWRAVSPTNRPSIRTAEKTGAVRILGEIRIEKTFGETRFTEDRFADRPLLTRSDPHAR